MADEEFIRRAKLVKGMLYQFMQKYHSCRAYSNISRTYCSKCYEGQFLGKGYKGQMPNDIQQLYAELELGTFYIEYETMSPMKSEYMNILNTVKKMNSTNTHWYFGTPTFLNKKFEAGSEKNIMMACIDEAYCWVVDY